MVQNIGSRNGGFFVWYRKHHSNFGEGVGHAQIGMEANFAPSWDWQGNRLIVALLRLLASEAPSNVPRDVGLH